MSKFIIFTFICALSSVVLCLEVKTRLIDFRLLINNHLSLSQRQVIPPTCARPGRTCGGDCVSVWTCLYNNKKWNSLLLEECKNGQFCNEGECSDIPSPRCSPEGNLPFVCTSEAVFPDPIDCRNFHFCVTPNGVNDVVDHPRTCDGGYMYDSDTTSCQDYLGEEECPYEYPIPLCTSPGQTGGIPQSSRLFYVCSLYDNTGIILYPYIYRCANGQQYDYQYSCINVTYH